MQQLIYLNNWKSAVGRTEEVDFPKISRLESFSRIKQQVFKSLKVSIDWLFNAAVEQISILFMMRWSGLDSSRQNIKSFQKIIIRRAAKYPVALNLSRIVRQICKFEDIWANRGPSRSGFWLHSYDKHLPILPTSQTLACHVRLAVRKCQPN